MQKRLNRSRYQKRAFLLMVLLLFLFLLLWFFFRRPEPVIKESRVIPDSTVSVPDTVKPFLDTLPVQKDTIVKKDTTIKSRRGPVAEKEKPAIQQDTVEEAIVVPDSLQDSVQVAVEPMDPCRNDSTELWVYPDPSGGLHRRSVAVSFTSNRKCTIRWRFEKNTNWVVYNGGTVNVDSSVVLVFDALDSCGNGMKIREEYYQIEPGRKESPCSPGMEHIKVGAAQFCIDRYEWPNRKGAVPLSYISMYHAQDSCFSVGKRLCTSEEWYLACTGPHSWKYPYGQSYERYACATHDSIAPVSGSRPECRGFFDVYDMSGSVMEWTSTRSRENSRFTYVVGGFWQSGPQSGCSDKRYSYYPQNRHNPVGFRCCQDLPEK